MYGRSDTLLLADVFEAFRTMCIEICELDPAHFLSAPELAWQACLKKTGVELELITNVDMLLMIEKAYDLPFLQKKTMGINKCNKLACNLYDKKKLCCPCKITKTSMV